MMSLVLYYKQNRNSSILKRRFGETMQLEHLQHNKDKVKNNNNNNTTPKTYIVRQQQQQQQHRMQQPTHSFTHHTLID